MDEDLCVELSLLLDNGMIDQFMEYELPKTVTPLIILESTIKSICRILKTRENLQVASKLILMLEKKVKEIGESSIPRSKISHYNVRGFDENSLKFLVIV